MFYALMYARSLHAWSRARIGMLCARVSGALLVDKESVGACIGCKKCVCCMHACVRSLCTHGRRAYGCLHRLKNMVYALMCARPLHALVRERRSICCKARMLYARVCARHLHAWARARRSLHSPLGMHVLCTHV